MTTVAFVLVLVVVLGVFYVAISPDFGFDGDSVLQDVLEQTGDSLEEAVDGLRP